MFGIRHPFLLIVVAIAALALGLALPVAAEAGGVIFGYSSGTTTLVSILAALGAAVAAYYLYRSSGQLLPSPVRIALGFARFIVLLLAMLMFLEPRLELHKKQSAPPVIAVLHDDSESMAINGDSAYVKGAYRSQLAAFMDKLQGGDASVQFSIFGSGLVNGQSVDSLGFDRPGTNISQALEETARRFGSQNLGAVVLVSDGIPTGGMNPLYTLEAFQQPVFTVLVGDTTPQRDVRISEVLYNEIAYLDNETPIKVKVNLNGYDKADLKVSISGGGKVIATQSLALSAALPSAEVDFVVKPERTGIQQYSIAVEPIAGELTTRNNFRNIFIKVLETKVKIALFAGYPHPDLGAMRSAMDEDGRYALSEFIHTTPSTFYNNPSAANLADFDLFILHNFPLSPSDAALMERIKGEVEARKSPFMLFVGQGTHMPTLQNALGTAMALVPGAASPNFEEAQLNFKAEYKEHSTFTFDDEWLRLMNSAPPLVRNQSEWKAAGDAKVFGNARIKNIVVDFPVFALRSHLERKNMTVVGENIWRLRQHAEVETGEAEAFDEWLYNNIQWLMVREDKRRFKVSSSKNLYAAGEPVLFRGEAYDESYRPLPGVDVKVTLKRPTGKEDVLYLNEAGNARYFLELANMEEGNYSFVAEGKKNDVKVGTDRGEFSIGRSNIEHFHLTADQVLMRQIALRTGGAFTHARGIESLADSILALKSLKPVVSYTTKRIGFNEYVWIFWVLLGLLAVEWAIRKWFTLP